MKTFALRQLPRHRPARQRGAAALVIVMLLFFVISLVAAYTSRNLIFEQRTASNQYRSTQALEAAEAGIEWTLAQLNAGLTTESCTATTASGNPSFRQRYLNIDNTTGNITPVALSAVNRFPTCVLDASSSNAADWKWSCVCPPATGTFTALTAPTGPVAAPAYVVQMTALSSGTPRPDLFEVISYSCTRFSTGSTECMGSFNENRGGTGDGIATTRVTVALRGAITRLPAATLTVAGTLAAPTGGAVLALQNGWVPANGITLHSAGPAPATGLALTGLPGATPSSTVVTGDTSLAPAAQGSFAAKDLRFAAVFGMQPQTYKRQPGLPILDCSGGCNAAAINTAIERNPGRPVWLSGSTGTVTIDGTVGSTSVPALLIVEGDVVFSGGASLTGFLYSRIKDDGSATVWSLNGNASLVGAAVVEGNLALGGSSTGVSITYDEAALKALRLGTGTFVRVPGSWRDFL